MTDQELTEKAGRALGWVDYPSDSKECGDTWHLEADKAPFGKTLPKDQWNPLEDDGDAFRLACSLKMDIMQYDESKDGYSSVSVNYMFDEECDEGSRAAATRRAIVRAAAGCAK